MPSSLVIRDRVDPRHLTVDITGTSGQHYRWGPDERDGYNIPTGISFQTQMPGGFSGFTCGLTRDPKYTYLDLARFAPCTVYGPGGGQVAYDGYLSSAPSTRDTSYAITPTAVGWSAHLRDNASFREIYIDVDLTKWAGTTVSRRIQLLNLNIDDQGGIGVSPDPSGSPSLETFITGGWGRQARTEAWYDAKGIPLGSMYYAWKTGPDIDSTNTNWSWQTYLCNDDVGTSNDGQTTLAPSPGTGTVTSTVHGSRKWALVGLEYGAAGGGSGQRYSVFWTSLALYGEHGLTIRGTQPGGFYGSDVVANIVSRTAPLLTSTAITQDSFIIPQLVFMDPITGADAIAEVNKYYLNDYGVYENRQFFWRPAGTGTAWHVRLSDGNTVTNQGPQIETAFNGVVVQYTDARGGLATVGPPGSTAQITDSSLQDTSSSNPVNAYPGRKRWAVLQMGLTTSGGAIRIGQIFLTTTNARQTSGTAIIVGTVKDSNGREQPAWMIRAGDTIIFDDTNDQTAHYVLNTSYDHNTLMLTATLDAPPNKLDWLLNRLNLVVAPLG